MRRRARDLTARARARIRAAREHDPHAWHHGSPEPEPIDLNAAVESMDRFIQMSLSADIAVVLVDQADGSTPVVDWAPEKRRWSLPIASGLGA